MNMPETGEKMGWGGGKTGVEVVQVDKAKLKKGFKFGMTDISLFEDELKEYDGKEFKSGKCLQLKQITQRALLNPSYLIGAETRVFLVDEKASNSATSFFMSLARTCQQEDTVLVVRYAYNIASTPHLLALFPYEEESGNMAFAGVRLAFWEDVRLFQFPPLEDAASRPTSHQLQLVDDLIDGMQLSEADGTNIDSELILEPSYQRICSAARSRALNTEEEEEDGGEKYLETLRPNKEMLKKIAATIEKMKNEERGFELIKKEKVKRPRIEIVPENVDDLLEEIEKNRIAEMTSQVEEKVEIKPQKKLQFKDKALIMMNREDMYALRVLVETVLDTSEGDSNFYPNVRKMLDNLREGAAKDPLLMGLFDEVLADFRESYPEFAEWMAEQSKQVTPFSGTLVDFWNEMKDIKPNVWSHFSDHFASLCTAENVGRVKAMVAKSKERNEQEIPIVTEGTSNDEFIEEIKIEAHHRKIAKMKAMQASEEDLSTLQSLINEHVSHPIVNNRYLISYTNYCKVRDSPQCPIPFKEFLSARLFEAFRADQKDYLGRVDAKRLLLYVHKKLLANHNLILLAGYSKPGSPYLTYDEFQEFLTQEIIPNIPGLHDQTNGLGDSTRILDPTYYTYFVEKKVHSLLDPLFTQKIRIIDLLATGVMDSLIDQFDAEKFDDLNNKFSLYSCEMILSIFRSLDEDTNGLLSYEELLQYNDCKYSSLFISNVFLTEKTFDDQQIDFTGFLNFYNAVENKKLIQSMRWMFRVLDEESKGYLTRKDIKDHMESLLRVIQERIPHLMASLEDLVDEVFDISRPVNPTRITLKDIIDSGKGDTVMGMMTNLDDYYTYETREDPKPDPDQE